MIVEDEEDEVKKNLLPVKNAIMYIGLAFVTLLNNIVRVNNQ